MVALAAARRSPKAGRMDDTHSGWVTRARAKCGEKVDGLRDGSPPVASSSKIFMGKSGADKASLGPCWGGERKKGAARPPPVVGAPWVCASQNWPLAALAVGREGTIARHSACVAGVMSSPAQAEGMRVPLLVQPGQLPRWTWCLKGHSKG